MIQRPIATCTVLFSCAAMLAFLAGCGTSPSSPSRPLVICDTNGVHSSSPKASRFGIFSESFYGDYPSALDSVTSLLGSKPGYVLWYQQIDDPFPAAVVGANAAQGIATVVSINVMSLSLDSAENDTLLDEVSNGMWDSTLTLFAAGAQQVSIPVYLRLGYEMNCTWFPWGGKPAAFVAAWIHARQVFAAQGATNVQWIFCPGAIWGNQTVDGSIKPYYPGDSAVDIVGVDGYNYGDGCDQYHSWESFDDIFRATLTGLAGIGKPIWICETACPSDARRPLWLRQVFSFMDDNPCVGALLWFDVHKPAEPDFRLESDTASLNVVRGWLSQ